MADSVQPPTTALPQQGVDVTLDGEEEEDGGVEVLDDSTGNVYDV